VDADGDDGKINYVDEKVSYTTRREYLSEDVVDNYVPNRFTGALGRYRFRREQNAVNSLINQVPAAEIQSILDCPTGIGRWLPNLAVLRPAHIMAVDVSPTMLSRAKTVELPGVSIGFKEGVAERLPFEEDSFDLVFCHALLKHLPEQVEFDVINELARVTSQYVIVAASVRRGFGGVVRKFRNPKGRAVSVSRPRFEQAVRDAGLCVVDSRKATTPLGSEYSYLLRKG
jgi:ubiquinone/menaquinone biosynthesis C-methylase UbiE